MFVMSLALRSSSARYAAAPGTITSTAGTAITTEGHRVYLLITQVSSPTTAHATAAAAWAGVPASTSTSRSGFATSATAPDAAQMRRDALNSRQKPKPPPRTPPP